MSSKRLRELESKLTMQQRKAALMVVEKELSPDSSVFGKSYLDIAEEVGVHKNSLYNWRTQNKVFIEYVNLLADDFLSSHRAEVYRHLMTAVRSGANGNPSIKAIDTYLKRFALLTERQVTEEADTSDSRKDEDIAKEIEELDALLDDEDENGGGGTNGD